MLCKEMYWVWSILVTSRSRVSQLSDNSILPCSDTQNLGLLANAQAMVILTRFKLQISFGPYIVIHSSALW